MDENERLIDATAFEIVLRNTHREIIGMNGDKDCADTILWVIEKLNEAPTIKSKRRIK